MSYLRNLLCGSALAWVGAVAAQAQPAAPRADFHQWAPSPPMGWNSWDCYGPTVTEAETRANADYMARHLKASGWEYVVVDIRWYVGNDTAHGYNEKNPDWNLDQYGRFVPAPNRFPSAAGGKGFKPLADYLHAKGLKFGIHLMRGVPVVAVQRRLPIKGTRLTAADIYTKDGQCQWLHDMYTVVPTRPGAQAYYNSLFELYASWGVDFVKIDDLSEPYHAGEIELIRRAIDRTGRKIVFSMSPGETPLADARHAQQHANMWRTVGDFWDSWEQLKEHFAVCARWAPYIMAGAWPDADMLPLGRLGIRAERGDDRQSRFTPDEQRTLMTLWSIFRSPLMFGGDLPSTDAATLALLTNPRVLAVHKASTHNRQLFRRGDLVGWVADDPRTGDKFLALFNAQDQEQAPASAAALAGPPISREVWQAPLDVDIAGAQKLYLVVRGGADGTAWDHADWLNPVLTDGVGKTLDLTTLPWRTASAGWGQATVGKSVSGGPLRVAGQTYAAGIGTHANSLIEYDVPAGYPRFRATVGLDQAAAGQNTGGTFQALVFTQSPLLPAPADSVRVPVALAELGLAGGATVQDLWSGQTLGAVSDEFAPYVRRHGAGFYRLVRRRLP
ncbi:Melibiase subfamily [Hymenobacter sp. RP-2-7]|uniref:Alpha-galactosidase n=1 Tax=Hymenobacter polaris TaxID=2682546 RepID=A0A7Y0AFW4_9BACT|nr:NPCBM/NEW2 domain-containing protein [Hymenobacter polaris]NML66576.1 Melibiase subfamily [Hymenobacter polaris]